MFAGKCTVGAGREARSASADRCSLLKTPQAVSRLKSLRQFHLYIFFSFGARAADHILPRFAQSETLKVGHHRTKETKNPPASEGGHYRRTGSPTRRSWLDWEVATRVLVEKR
jgi:hypothetical protein